MRYPVEYLLDKTLPERAESDGHESSVVEDHGLRVHLVDVILDVGHEELVSRHVVPIVQCVVVHGAEQSAGATEGILERDKDHEMLSS